MNDDHLLQLSDILGPIPGFLRSQWPRADVYFNAEGEKIKNYIGDLPEGHLDPEELQPEGVVLEERFEREKPAEIRPEEAKEITALLRWILQYDESERPSTTEILRHPWFLRVENLSN